jgi:hypothetical protein
MPNRPRLQALLVPLPRGGAGGILPNIDDLKPDAGYGRLLGVYCSSHPGVMVLHFLVTFSIPVHHLHP